MKKKLKGKKMFYGFFFQKTNKPLDHVGISRLNAQRSNTTCFESHQTSQALSPNVVRLKCEAVRFDCNCFIPNMSPTDNGGWVLVGASCR